MFQFEDDDSAPSGEEEQAVTLTDRSALSSYPRPELVHEIALDVGVDEIPASLRQMVHLTRLKMSNGQISRIENLEGCKQLVHLNLSKNLISTITGLRHNTLLQVLVLDCNPISCLKPGDLAAQRQLRELSLCGAHIDNLWMTASALQELPALRKLAFCRFDRQYMSRLLHDTEQHEDIALDHELNAEGIIDYVARHIGDMTIEEIGGRIHQISELSGSFTEKLHHTDWSTLERMSGRLGLSGLPQRIKTLGERLQVPDLVIFGERLEALSVPATLSYLSSLKQRLAAMTGTGASSLSNLLQSIQIVINTDSEDFLLDDLGSSSEDDELFFDRELEGNSLADHFSCPICLEKHYTEFFVHHLPALRVFDGARINDAFRVRATEVYFSSFQDVPLVQRHTTLGGLLSRELGGHPTSRPGPTSGHFQRILSTSLLNRFANPRTRSISSSAHAPRQFEYHPQVANLMVYGTMQGELMAVNTATGHIVAEAYSRSPRPILALCWLHQDERKFLAGSDDGTIDMYDTGLQGALRGGEGVASSVAHFDAFSDLTSLHVNSTDQYCLTSGFSSQVYLYDIGEGRVAQSWHNLHQQHINVLKFAHHNPNLFATSSFDEEVKLWDLRDMTRPVFTRKSNQGNVMVCFSPDDKYILSSAVDNEVRQYLTDGGRLHLNLDIKKSYSKHNYTRSYYMNNGEYIIVGSCQEGLVRIFNASTGKFLRDVLLSYERSDDFYCQSLRADPYYPFCFSALVASKTEAQPLEISEINLVQQEL